MRLSGTLYFSLVYATADRGVKYLSSGERVSVGGEGRSVRKEGLLIRVLPPSHHPVESIISAKNTESRAKIHLPIYRKWNWQGCVTNLMGPTIVHIGIVQTCSGV